MFVRSPHAPSVHLQVVPESPSAHGAGQGVRVRPRRMQRRRSCIDLGLTHFAILSAGEKIDNPRFLRRAEKRLKKTQRTLTRKEKGSKNREKARIKVARAHAAVADARKEFHHQLSTRLIRENQAIGVENLAVNGLARSRLAKSVHDAGWARFVTMLEYKAARYGRRLVTIGRFLPTSQTCHVCGRIDGPKPLHVRTWTCPGCAIVHDRDINSAINVKKAAGHGGHSLWSAGKTGASVPAQRSEAGSHGFPAEARAAAARASAGKARIIGFPPDEHAKSSTATHRCSTTS